MIGHVMSHVRGHMISHMISQVTGIASRSTLIAVAFLIVCVLSLVYPSHEIYSEIFVVPVGSVFAFPAIRQGFPGSPTGFGKFPYTLVSQLVQWLH